MRARFAPTLRRYDGPASARATLTVVACTLGLGCGADATPAPRTAPPPATRVASAKPTPPEAAPAGTAPHEPEVRPEPEPKPEMEALLRAREAFFADDGTVGAAPATPTSTPARLRIARTGTIEPSRIARIDALTNNDRFGRGPTCTAMTEPFAAGGRFCGDVRLPAVTLSEAEMRSVVQLLEAAERSYGPKSARDGQYADRPVLRCGFDPHHALVLYDAAGSVIGTLTICMSCHEWVVRPASPGTGAGAAVMFDEGERKALAAIFDAHELGAWIFDDADPRGAAVIAYERAVYGTEAEPTPRGEARRRARIEAHRSGVESTKKLRDLARAERARLCTWTSETVRPGRRDGSGHGYECTDGTTWSATYGEPNCVERTLACDGTVSELETCLIALREPEHLCAPPPRACERFMECLPGIERRSGRASRPSPNR